MSDDTTINIEILGVHVEVEIHYSSYGNDVPATYFEPAEYAEIVVENIYRLIDGNYIDIKGMFTEEEHEKIIEILQESFSD